MLEFKFNKRNNLFQLRWCNKKTWKIELGGWVTNPDNIAKSSWIGPGVVIDSPEVVIGENCHIYGKITISGNVYIANSSQLRAGSEQQSLISGQVIIAENVKISGKQFIIKSGPDKKVIIRREAYLQSYQYILNLHGNTTIGYECIITGNINLQDCEVANNMTLRIQNYAPNLVNTRVCSNIILLVDTIQLSNELVSNIPRHNTEPSILVNSTKKGDIGVTLTEHLIPDNKQTQAGVFVNEQEGYIVFLAGNLANTYIPLEDAFNYLSNHTANKEVELALALIYRATTLKNLTG